MGAAKKEDLKKLEKELKKMVLGYSAFYSSVFTTASAGIFSLYLGNKYKDAIVEVVESGVNILAIVLKLYSMFI